MLDHTVRTVVLKINIINIIKKECPFNTIKRNVSIVKEQFDQIYKKEKRKKN